MTEEAKPKKGHIEKEFIKIDQQSSSALINGKPYDLVKYDTKYYVQQSITFNEIASVTSNSVKISLIER